MRIRRTLLPLVVTVAIAGSLSACAGAAGSPPPSSEGAVSASPTPIPASSTPAPSPASTSAEAIEGRWTVGGDVRTAITFSADGTWTATSSCTTGAVGGRGVYVVLPGGRLRVTRTETPIRGCPVVDGPVVGPATAITAIARAGSFRVGGDTLTLFDRDGNRLGTLVRG